MFGFVDEYFDVFESVCGFGFMIGFKCKVLNVLIVSVGYDVGLLLVFVVDNVVCLLFVLNISDDDFIVVVELISKVVVVV